MAFQLDATAIAHVSMNPAVRDAAAVGAGLIELWPLTDAKQMDNDTKYGENLQVRMTRMAARVMTGDDVTVPDAEFVYEVRMRFPVVRSESSMRCSPRMTLTTRWATTPKPATRG